jgi:hypothetical protein
MPSKYNTNAVSTVIIQRRCGIDVPSSGHRLMLDGWPYGLLRRSGVPQGRG